MFKYVVYASILLMCLSFYNVHRGGEIDNASIFFQHKHDIVLGNSESLVKLIEYSSPSCIHCSRFKSTIFPIIKQQYIYTNKIAYIVRPFISNKKDKAAYMLNICGGKESFLKLNDIINKSQKYWAFNNNYDEVLGSIAKASNLNYEKCLQNTEMETQIINQTLEIMGYNDFLGTPSLFIGDRLYKGNYTVKDISRILDLEISKTSSQH
jgi:protein-disulfide isomerase